MSALNCYICDKDSLFYRKDIFKLRSKHSQTLICDFIIKILGNELAHRATTDPKNDTIVCMECLHKIDEFDLASITVQRVEKELRDILIHTESLYASGASGVYKQKHVETADSDDVEQAIIETEIPTKDNYGNFNGDDYDDIACDAEESEYNDNLEETVEHSIDFQSKRTSNKRVVTVGLECKACSIKFKTLDEMKNHKHRLLTMYEIEKPIKPICPKKPIKPSSRIYKCNITTCLQEFSLASKYKEHMIKHLGKFRCQICGLVQESESNLNEHEALHKELDPLVCVLCKKSFKKKGALSRHVRIHNGEKFYQCEKCGKDFVHKSSFSMHIMAHEDIRDKICPHCPLKFRSTSHLNRHLKTHTGAKPFSCPECGQKFAQSYNMKVHYRLHKDLESQNIDKCHLCTICGTRFSRAMKLAQHYRRAHDTMIPHTAIGNDLDHSNTVKGKGNVKD